MTDSVQLALGKKKVADDFKVLLADTEELLRQTASMSEEGIQALRARLQQQLDVARGRLAEAQASAAAKARVACSQADEFVKANPWQAVGIGVGAGLVLGVLMAR
jgi:ElaB/YqjD/DUF883 family membrane-anchored ribosome-binding protein